MDPPGVVDQEGVRRGERERGYEAWRGDVYGWGGELRGKRRGRGGVDFGREGRTAGGEWRRYVGEGEYKRCEGRWGEGVGGLLEWKGEGGRVFDGRVPWLTEYEHVLLNALSSPVRR